MFWASGIVRVRRVFPGRYSTKIWAESVSGRPLLLLSPASSGLPFNERATRYHPVLFGSARLYLNYLVTCDIRLLEHLDANTKGGVRQEPTAFVEGYVHGVTDDGAYMVSLRPDRPGRIRVYTDDCPADPPPSRLRAEGKVWTEVGRVVIDARLDNAEPLPYLPAESRPAVRMGRARP